MHDISNITTIYHCTGIIFNTRDEWGNTPLSNTTALFHCMGIFFNTRDMWGKNTKYVHI